MTKRTPMPHKPIVTAKGTELPVMDLKGKPYLQVAHRLVWFREEHPDWTIMTEFPEVNTEKRYVIAKATVTTPLGQVIATAHKTESAAGFADYLEKAETGAIGRALALCGYGTQFAPEIDEGERIVDSPVDLPHRSPTSPHPAPQNEEFDHWQNGMEGDVEVLILHKAERSASTGTRMAYFETDLGMTLKAFGDTIDAIEEGHQYALTVKASLYNGKTTYNVQRVNSEL